MPRDIAVKLSEEGPLENSKIYTNPEFETVDFAEAGDESADADENEE